MNHSFKQALRSSLAFSILALAGCDRQETPSPVATTATANAIAAIAPAPTAPAPTPAPTPPASAVPDAPAVPRIASILDQDRGTRALAQYRRFVTDACASAMANGGDPREKLEKAGFPDADELLLCADAAGATDGATAIASGSFDRAGADEVVLWAWSGKARADGDHALVLMRREGDDYRFIRQLMSGNDSLTARARVVTQGRDLLLLCHLHGQQGLYATTCGFLGRGSFTSSGEAGNDDDIPLGASTRCGPGGSVELGEPTIVDQHLRVPLVIERFVLQKGAAGRVCNKRSATTREVVVLDHAIYGDQVRRLTPLPKVLDEIVMNDE